MKRVLIPLVAIAVISSAAIAADDASRHGLFRYWKTIKKTSTGSITFTNSTERVVSPTSVSVDFNTSYAATVMVSRVSGTVTNDIAKFEGQSAVRSVCFNKEDLDGFRFIPGEFLLVEDDSNAGTNSNVRVDFDAVYE